MPKSKTKTDEVWISINGRTFVLKSARDVTPQEMIELALPPENASLYVAGIPPGLRDYAVYSRRYMLPPRPPIPKISHKKLWQLGRHYANFAAPHIIEQAKRTNFDLPARKTSQLFPVLKDVYDLLEQERGIPWDSLLVSMQDDFLIGFWNRLREKGILERTR